MDIEEDTLGNNSIEDVSWLCNLSESELEFLMSLKMLVIQRSRTIRRQELAEKFDLKMLRGLGLVLMECLKEKLKYSCDPASSGKFAESLDKSSLLKLDPENVTSIEEIKSCVRSSSRKSSSESHVRSTSRRRPAES